MKFILAIVIFICLSFPAFSQQTGHAQRVRNLSDSMDTVITMSNENLSTFDQMIGSGDDMVTFSAFRRRHEYLESELHASELRLHFLIRSTSRSADISAERNNYERLIRELETVKTELDNYMRTVQ